MRYEFHPEALLEYEEAAQYYANCQPGLGDRFVNAVESLIEKISESPRRCRIIEQDIRRCLTRIFPYAVLYTVEPDHILIIRRYAREP